MEKNNQENILKEIIHDTRSLNKFFHEISGLILERESDEYQFGNLTSRQVGVLITVKELCNNYPEGISLSQLTRKIGITAPSASCMVDTLVQKGFLNRERCPDDRRSVLIKLAPDIRRKFEICDQAVLDAMSKLTENIDESIIKRWHKIMIKLRQVINDANIRDIVKANAEDSSPLHD